MNIERLRGETPGCSGLIHLNNAGASLSPQSVIQAVNEHLALEARIGGYEAELAKRAELQAVYGSLARLLGARSHEIAVTQNATRAWDMVFYAVTLQPGDRILTCQAEYASNYIAFLQRARQTGAEIVLVDSDRDGAICLDSFRRLLDERVKVVSINHVPTNRGLVQPAAEIGRLMADHPAIYLLDACQSVGQIPLDVTELGCDALSATSRKFLRGPRGLGFLYVREALIEALEPPMLDLHSAVWTHPDRYAIQPDARRFETYETFVAGRLGLGAAAEYALALDGAAVYQRIQQLAQHLRTALDDLAGVEVHELGEQQCGIVTFTHHGHDPEALAHWLRGQGMNLWTSSANSARLDMEARGLSRVMRASPHYYNTEEELDLFLSALKRCPLTL